MVNDGPGHGVAWTLRPPDGGICQSIALVAGQTLIIECGESKGVLLVRQADDLDIDFGDAGSIRIVNGALAPTMHPVPRIAGRDGGSLPLDQVIDALTAVGVVGAADAAAPERDGTTFVIPFLSGIAVPALLDRTGLHLGVPEVNGIPSSFVGSTHGRNPEEELRDDVWTLLSDDPAFPGLQGGVATPANEMPPSAPPEPETPVVPEPAALPDSEEALAPGPQVPGVSVEEAPVEPEDTPANVAAADAAVLRPALSGRDRTEQISSDASGVPGMIYGDAELQSRVSERGRRIAAIRRSRRRLCEAAGDDRP